METIAVKQAQVAKAATATKNIGWYDKLIEKAKFNYFGIIAMTIAFGSIMGGITAMYIFQNDAPTWELGVCMMGAMANLVSALGQAPAKWVVNMFALSFVIDVALILANVL